MKIENIIVGDLQTNCYIISKNNDAIIIDPGDEADKIINACKNYEVKGILVTHHHFDHIMALEKVEKYYKLLHNPKEIKGFSFDMIETPGHTSDSLTYYFPDEKVMFVGDFIFKDSIGRCDLPTGDINKMIESLKYISSYPDDITLYPGHGEKTTLKDEKRHFRMYY